MENQNENVPEWAKTLIQSNWVLLEKVNELNGQRIEASGAQKVLDKLQENEAKKRDEEANRKRTREIVKSLMKE